MNPLVVTVDGQDQAAHTIAAADVSVHEASLRRALETAKADITVLLGLAVDVAREGQHLRMDADAHELIGHVVGGLMDLVHVTNIGKERD